MAVRQWSLAPLDSSVGATRVEHSQSAIAVFEKNKELEKQT